MNDALTITGLAVRAVDVPIAPLRTASGVITSSPLVLIDLTTSGGVVGRSYLFAYTRACLQPLASLVRNFAPLIVGQPAAPFALIARLSETFRLVGTGGLMAMAIGGLDMALWDAQAKACGVPLVALLGGTSRRLPAYWSVGMCGPAEARRAAERALAHGCRALKIKIGFADLADDLAAIAAVREVAGDALHLMVDYNQSLSAPEAERRIRRLEAHSAGSGQAEALHWIEEPLLAEDFDGHAALARAAATPIQLGENWSGCSEMAKSLAARASDLAMIDVMKIGGVTGWQRAATLAAAHGLPVSSHLFPEFSAHLLAVTPTVHWLEFLDLASAVLREPARVENGVVATSAAPGAGIDWNEAAVEKYAAGN
jgi:mandelate racemase